MESAPFGALARILADADHLHSECLAEHREMAADTAHADHQHGLAAEFVLALGQVADHAAPDLLVLIVARLGQASRQGEDQRYCVLGHGARIDAGGAAQTDVPARKLLPGILVHARADRLDELQLRRGGISSFFHMPETTTTSASPTRFWKSS